MLYVRNKKKQISIPRPTININLIRKLHINETNFQENFDKLCKKWWDVGIFPLDSSGRRMVTSTLMSRLTDPIILAAIADDVDCFQKFYDAQKQNNDVFYLNFCAICGSHNIIEKMFLNDDKKQCLIDSENAIAYAISSGKESLVIFLAQLAVKFKKSDPGPITLYSTWKDQEIVNKIEKMFTDTTLEISCKKAKLSI